MTETPSAPQEISLVEAVWRYRLMSLSIVVVCALAAVAVTQVLFSGVQASARFAISDPTNKNSLNLGVVSGPGFSTFTAQRAVFAQSAPVLRRATEILAQQGGPKRTLAQMRSRVRTEAEPDGGVVHVSATGESMSIAAATANSVIKSYQELSARSIKEKRERQLKNIKDAQKSVAVQLLKSPAKSRQAGVLAGNLTKLQQQESTLLTEVANDSDGVQFVDAADPSAAVSSKLPRNAVIGLAVGVLLAAVASFLRASAPGASAPGTLRGGAPGGGNAGGGRPSWRARRRPAKRPVATPEAVAMERAGTPWPHVDMGESTNGASREPAPSSPSLVSRAAVTAPNPSIPDKAAKPSRPSKPSKSAKDADEGAEQPPMGGGRWRPGRAGFDDHEAASGEAEEEDEPTVPKKRPSAPNQQPSAPKGQGFPTPSGLMRYTDPEQ